MTQRDPRIAAGTSALLLAPMEGVLDAPLRQIYSELGGFTFCVSEFIRVSSTPTPPGILLELVPELREPRCQALGGLPVQVQLLGSDPVLLAETAARAVQLGAWGIDLNFGCPAATVNRHGGGATLLRFPEKLSLIARHVRSAIGSGVALSAKIRLGWDSACDAPGAAQALTEAGVDWLVVHGRTRQQGYSGEPQWGSVQELVREIPIPVVANGDIRDVQSLRMCRDATGTRHFMLGRGALADPSLAFRLSQELGIVGPESKCHPLVENFDPASASCWLPLLERFLVICEAGDARPGYSLRRIKQWLGWAAQINSDARSWVDPLKRTSSIDEALALLQQHGEHSICKTPSL